MDSMSATFKKNSDLALFRELITEMESPIDLGRVNEMVILIPCSHKVQALVLKKLKEKENLTCTKCTSLINGYLPTSQAIKISGLLAQMSESFKIEKRLSALTIAHLP